MTSPTTALAGQRPSSTTGKTSVTGIRPISERWAGCGVLATAVWASACAEDAEDSASGARGVSVGAAADLEGRGDCFLPALGVVFGVTGARLR